METHSLIRSTQSIAIQRSVGLMMVIQTPHGNARAPRASTQEYQNMGGDPRIPNNRWLEDGCIDQSVLRLVAMHVHFRWNLLHSIEMACAGLLGKDGMSIQHLQPLRFQEIDLSKAEGGRPSAAVATLLEA